MYSGGSAKGERDVNLSASSFQKRFHRRLWRMIKPQLNAGQNESIVKQKLNKINIYRLPRRRNKKNYLDWIGSPGLWNGLHITSVKELCNFLNIWKTIISYYTELFKQNKPRNCKDISWRQSNQTDNGKLEIQHLHTPIYIKEPQISHQETFTH